MESDGPSDSAADSAAESDDEKVEADIAYSDTWPNEIQELLLKRGVNDYTIRDRFGSNIFLPTSYTLKPENFPLQVVSKVEEGKRCLDEKVVIKFEEVILKLRSLGASGAGLLHSAEHSRGLTDFAVAFGGGGVRSGAFCSGVLWALAEQNRLRHVTHVSSVSGGSIAASGFASFMVQDEARRRAAGEASEADGGPSSEQRYREVVADFIERSQRNAGYLVSFNNLWKVPEDNSSSSPRIWDLPLMFLVVLGVLVAAPAVFCVFYVVPVTLLIEAFWGGAMRNCYCSNFHLKVPCSYTEIIQPHGSFSLYLIFVMVALLMILALVYKCCGMDDVLKDIRNGQKRDTRWFLYWRSLTHLCTRWVVMMVMILATVLLVYTAELWDYGERRMKDGPIICKIYYDEGRLCSDLVRAPSDTLPNNVTGLTAAEESLTIDDLAILKQEHTNGLPNFIVIFFFLTMALALVSASFKMLGWSGMWRVFLFILLPLWFIWPASFLLQWRVFGPVTKQALLTPFFDAQLVGKYNDKAWYCFTSSSLAVAIVCLPAFNLLHRFVHYYFRWSLQRAFYHGGVDTSMRDVARCASVPILLFGATLNEFQRPESKEAHSLFSLSQYAMGCQRTDFLPAPNWMSLARCMTLSCAAIDGFVLTQINKWHTRILMAMLNLTQGDWLRFDRGQKWASKRWPQLLKEPHKASMIDRLPEMILFAFIYLFCLLANDKSRPMVGLHQLDVACQPFRLFTMLTMLLIVLFVGVLSFFGHVRWLNWLLDSPLVRQIHMFLMYHECMEKPPMYLYLTDGGPVEDLGLVQLLRRQRRWILSFDVGDDPGCDLLDLRAAIALARQERLCSFYLHKDPRRNLEDVFTAFQESKEEFLHLGVLYSDDRVGEIFHVRMRLLDETVPVQPLVQREEVLLRSSPLSPASPQVHGDVHVEMQDYMVSSQSSSSSNSRPLKPRGQLAGICCECCHDGHECNMCGSFPHTHTVNQFFTPTVWANFCRLGREMAHPAILKLTQRQQEHQLGAAYRSQP